MMVVFCCRVLCSVGGFLFMLSCDVLLVFCYVVFFLVLRGRFLDVVLLVFCLASFVRGRTSAPFCFVFVCW